MTRVYVALGSNLRDPLLQITQALQAIDQIPETRRIATSSCYRTPPYGLADQPDFLNAVIALETSLLPGQLLDHTQRIELEQGRVRRDQRWGARTLDLDILLYGQQQIQTERLIVPHYDMHNRAFMLLPLSEIAPHCQLPDGQSVRTLLDKLNTRDITLW